MSIGTVNEEKISELRSSLRGQVILPGEAGYDEARAIWNGMIDRRPAVIVRCADARDVMTAVAFTREIDRPGTVRGGGHNIAGNAVCDDGVVIDLSLIKHVQVDPEARIAKAGGGVLWGEFDLATQDYGLAATGGLISTTGIAGFTLGGGMGWLERKHGLTCDNLIAADVVTADGKLLHASVDENPDLFWAIRGGGGNFGIVTEFTLQLHPVGPMVLGGMLVWPLSEAQRVYEFYREYTANLPDEFTTMASLITAPPAPFVPTEMHGQKGVAIVGCHAGDLEEGRRVLAPLRALSPALDLFSEVPYVGMQTMLDPLAPPAIRNYWKSEYLSSVSDEFVRILIEHFQQVPSPMTHVDVHHLEGAYGRVGEDETAFSHRDARYVVNIVGAWTDPADDERNISWIRGLWTATQPYSLDSTYINFMANEGEASIRAAYGDEKYRRLSEIKRKYDPTNFFRYNHNIEPAQ